MVGRVFVYSVVLTAILFLLPLRASAQAITVYGPDLGARRCYDSATAAVDLDATTPHALKSCTTALEGGALKTKDKSATHLNRGILNAVLKDYGAALRDYDDAMRLYPGYGAIYVNRGNIFFIRGSFDTAIGEYTKALGAEMNEYQVPHLNRGMAHENLAHFDAAEADYRRALEIVPDWDLAKSKLARVLGKRN